MTDTSSLEDFLNDLDVFKSTLSNPQDLLSRYADDIVEGMKRNVPVDTGALKGSIRWAFDGDTSIAFQMFDYGYYQNYGVKPFNFTSEPKSFSNEFGTLRNPYPSPSFGMGNGYQTPRRTGMMARKFFDEAAIVDFIEINFTEDIITEFREA